MIKWIIIVITVLWSGYGYAYSQTGMVSYYWSGKVTASGERFNKMAPTCAHRWLPFGTPIELGYRGRIVWCRVNDRGPFVRGRILDVSLGVAKRLGITGAGVVRTTINWTER